MKNLDTILAVIAAGCSLVFGYGWAAGATKNLSLYGWAAGAAVTGAAVGGRYLWNRIPPIEFTGNGAEDELCELYKMQQSGLISHQTFMLAVKELVTDVPRSL